MTDFEVNYNEYTESNPESIQSEIDSATNYAKSDLNDLQSEILWWNKKVEFKTPDSINNFYRLEWENIIFQLDEVKNYLNDVYIRLSWMKVQNFWEIVKENNFIWTILSIQIALKAMETDPQNPKKYDIGRINWEYNERTKEAIKQFQTDNKLIRKDGKPWKETIGKLIKNLEELINNKKLEIEGQKTLRNEISTIIEESCKYNLYWWVRTESKKEWMINYLIEWNLWSNKDTYFETQIINLSKHLSNWKLKYLTEHTNEPLKYNLEKIKEIDNKTAKYNIIAPRTFTQYTSWNNLTQWQKDVMAEKLKQLWSPITVEMIQDSCQRTNIPVEYLLAFMQNDSRLWTDWRRAIDNHNPWNVWNTNSGKNRYYATREEWVLWCAEHLRDRISAHWNKFKKFPTVIEIAKWVWFKGVYMTAKNWPTNVNINLRNRVNRLKWK